MEIPGDNKTRQSDQDVTVNGTQTQQSSPPVRSINPPAGTHPKQNGTFHHYSPPQPAKSLPRPTSSSPQSSPNSIMYRNHNPSSRPAAPQPQPSLHAGLTNSSDAHSPSTSSQSFSTNTGQQIHNPASKPQPISVARSPTRQVLPQVDSHAIGDGARHPSPVFNRPTMSPTQGNMDVGPVAGVPQKSSVHGHTTNGNGVNGVSQYPVATPRASSHPSSAQTPTTMPLSGLSPKKQQTPIAFATPLHVPKPGGLSTPLASSQQTSLNAPTGPGSSQVQKRSVSGTLILPPVENLRPSPEQMRNMSSNEPVPTPSKQSPPQTFYNTDSVPAHGNQPSTQETPSMVPTGLGISPPP